MDLSQSGISHERLNDDKNPVLQNKPKDLDISNNLSLSKILTLPNATRRDFDLRKLNNLVITPSKETLKTRFSENFILFQLLTERYLKTMATSSDNICHVEPSRDIQTCEIISSCSKAVKDGVIARKMLNRQRCRLNKPAKFCSGNESTSSIADGDSNDIKKSKKENRKLKFFKFTDDDNKTKETTKKRLSRSRKAHNLTADWDNSTSSAVDFDSDGDKETKEKFCRTDKPDEPILENVKIRKTKHRKLKKNSKGDFPLADAAQGKLSEDCPKEIEVGTKPRSKFVKTKRMKLAPDGNITTVEEAIEDTTSRHPRKKKLKQTMRDVEVQANTLSFGNVYNTNATEALVTTEGPKNFPFGHTQVNNELNDSIKRRSNSEHAIPAVVRPKSPTHKNLERPKTADEMSHGNNVERSTLEKQPQNSFEATLKTIAGVDLEEPEVQKPERHLKTHRKKSPPSTKVTLVEKPENICTETPKTVTEQNLKVKIPEIITETYTEVVERETLAGKSSFREKNLKLERPSCIPVLKTNKSQLERSNTPMEPEKSYTPIKLIQEITTAEKLLATPIETVLKTNNPDKSGAPVYKTNKSERSGTPTEPILKTDKLEKLSNKPERLGTPTEESGLIGKSEPTEQSKPVFKTNKPHKFSTAALKTDKPERHTAESERIEKPERQSTPTKQSKPETLPISRNFNSASSTLPLKTERPGTPIEPLLKLNVLESNEGNLNKSKTPRKASEYKHITDPQRSSSKSFFSGEQNSSTATTCSYKTSETAKACIQYSRTAQQALSVLNQEVNSVLRDSFCSIDNICMCVRRTVDEINESHEQYEKMKTEQKGKLVSQSSPHLLELEEQNVGEPKSSLLHALSLGLVQTQSENQVRLALTPEEPSLTEESLKPLIIPPLAPTTEEIPILPKLVPIVEPRDQPCTILKQQKKDLFNIPSSIPLPATPKNFRARKHSDAQGLKTPLSKKILTKELSPEIKQRLKEIAVRLGLEDLPRIKAQSNLHTRLIKEFEAADSLIEFQRQMKHVKEANVTPPLKADVVQIIAEELFVPGRKINKIAATNLNVTSGNRSPLKLKPKTCQFLYREKKKAYARKEFDPPSSSNTIELPTKSKTKEQLAKEELHKKYADSLWFSRRRKSNKEKSASLPVSVTNSTTVKCGSSHTTTLSDNGPQTQTDDIKPTTKSHVQSVYYKTGLDCFDILDEISLRDLKPLESEYPRKDDIGSVALHTQVENTYLYKLVYGSTQDQFLQLLRVEEPRLYCKEPECKMCKAALKVIKAGRLTKDCKRKTSDIAIAAPLCDTKEMKRVEKNRKTQRDSDKSSGVVSSSSNASNYSKNSISNDSKWVTRGGSTQRRRSLSIENKMRRSFSVDNNVSATENKKLIKTETNHHRRRSKSKKIKKISEEDVATKLKPYMFDPRMRYPTTITVMPVSVTTTYANPNFDKQAKLKGQSGDYSPSSPKLPNKTEPKEKLNKPTAKQPLSDKKLWSNKYPKMPSFNLMSYLEKQNLDNPQQSFGDRDEHFNVDVPLPSRQISKKGAARSPHQPYQAGKTKKAVTFKKPLSSAKQPENAAKTLKDAQRQHKKEIGKNIQNVIDIIEAKIVDIVSTPDQSHSDAFNNVEKEIVDILKTIRADNDKPLAAIDEGSDTKGETTDSEGKRKWKTKKSKLHSKTIADLEKPLQVKKGDELRSETDPQLVSGLLISEGTSRTHSSASHDVDMSSTEERFEVTASCAPTTQKPPLTSSTEQKLEETLNEVEKPNLNTGLLEISEANPQAEMEMSKIEVEVKTESTEKLERANSDEFLTPFMHALKQYRQEDHSASSYNVLEFLDALTNISDDLPGVSAAKPTNKTIHYRRKDEVAHIFHQPEVFYPITIYHPVVTTAIANNMLATLLESRLPPKIVKSSISSVASKLGKAKELFSSSLNLGFFDLPKQVRPTNTTVVCCRVDKILPRLLDQSTLVECQTNVLRKSLTEFKQGAVIQHHTSTVTLNEDHSTLLNSFYGFFFTAIFLSLAFNYSCQWK